jgi:hypothetical protein
VQSNWKLSPSDFAFLWEECKRCFYLKVAHGVTRPRMPMPKIFTIIDLQMKNHYSGARTDQISKDMPRGKIAFEERWVKSVPIAVPGHTSTCYIKGKFDTIAELDDGTFAVIDFKTAERKQEHLSLYGRQLHAYAFALEHPAPNTFGVGPVSVLGLLVYEPDSYIHQEGRANLSGSVSWIEIPRNDKAFMAFLSDVLAVLEASEPPDPHPHCEWCMYRGSK